MTGSSGEGDHADLTARGEPAARPTYVRARRRCHVGVVAARRHGHVACVGPLVVARVERNDHRRAGVRYEDLDTGVGATLAQQVAGHVPGRQPDQVAEREHQVRGVLADAATAGECFRRGGLDRGHAVLVGHRRVEFWARCG